jgi:hypothetical protein
VKLLATLILTAAIVGVYAHRVATGRQQGAQAWSSQNVQFAATGLLGNNLQAFLPDGDQVTCDTLVDSVVTDRDDVRQIKRAGFTQLSCMARTGDLR